MQSCSTENRKTKRIQNLDEGVREGLALKGFSACWTPLWSDCTYQGLCLAWSDLDFSCKSQEVMATHVVELMAPVSAFTFRELLSLSSVSLVAFFLISGVHRQVQVPSRAKSWAQFSCGQLYPACSSGPWPSQVVSGDGGKKRQGELGWSQEDRNLKVNLLGNIGSHTIFFFFNFFYLHIDL